MSVWQGQLMMLEKSQWNDDDEDDGNKLTSLEERVMKLSELVNKIGKPKPNLLLKGHPN